MGWLAWLDTLNLIDVFNYYLIVAIVVSVVVRLRTYRAILGLVLAGPGRWPKLLQLMNKHRTVFLGWPTLLTLGLALAILLANSLASHWVVVQARLTFEELRGLGLPCVAVIISGGLMLFLDGRAILRADHFDRPALEENLDRAESWLNSWMAPAVRVVTFGFVHPRRLVGVEVHRLLVKANWVMIGGMWRSSLRTGMQLAFGLSLWVTWAFALRKSA